MINYVMAEMQKIKRTFGAKIVWIGPIVTLLISVVLTIGSDSFQNGAYNWWYIGLLEGTLAILCSSIIQCDKKSKYGSIFTLPLSKRNIWIGKIITCSYLYLIISVIFMIGIAIGGLMLNNQISTTQNIIATIVLFITFLWIIPLCMFLASKIGMVGTVLVTFMGSIFGVVAVADTSKYLLWPFAIPVRLMCPILNILPNGLPVESGSNLLNSSVIIPGIVVSIVVFIILTVATSMYFEKVEGK